MAKPEEYGAEFQDRDFTGGGIHSLPQYHGSTGSEEVDQQIVDLVEGWNCGPFNDLIEHIECALSGKQTFARPGRAQ